MSRTVRHETGFPGLLTIVKAIDVHFGVVQRKPAAQMDLCKWIVIVRPAVESNFLDTPLLDFDCRAYIRRQQTPTCK